MALMHVEYDDDSDAAFVWLVADEPKEEMIAHELWPPELRGKIGLLFDDQSRVIGLEVLEASVHLRKELLESR